MKVVLLCAGKGTRIREITNDSVPKPMIEVDGKSLLERNLEFLSQFDVDQFLINLHHLGEEIENTFGNEYKGIEISYYREESLLGTAGALTNMKDDIDNRFLVVYGDIITNLNVDRFVRFQKESDSLGTILTYTDEEKLRESSLIKTNDNSTVEEFIEKPSEDQVSDFEGEILTNAGIYCFEPKIIDYIYGESDFGNDIFPKIIIQGERIKSFRLPKDAYWREIGNPESYHKLEEDIDKGKIDWR